MGRENESGGGGWRKVERRKGSSIWGRWNITGSGEEGNNGPVSSFFITEFSDV